VAAGVAVRHHRSDDVEADALGFAEQGHEDERGENGALQKNGNGQGAALYAALTRELLGVTVHQASA
jgi:hypothetical protein